MRFLRHVYRRHRIVCLAASAPCFFFAESERGTERPLLDVLYWVVEMGYNAMYVIILLHVKQTTVYHGSVGTLFSPPSWQPLPDCSPLFPTINICPLFCLWQEQAPQGGCSNERNPTVEAAAVNKSVSTSSSSDINQSIPTTPSRPPVIDAVSSLGRTRLRPSTFRSPLPASPLRASKLLGGSGKDKGVQLNWEEESETCSKAGSGNAGGRKM